MISLTLRTPLVAFRSALALNGLRTREEYDELVHTSPDCDVRVTLAARPQGQRVRCGISLAEERLLVSGLELFNEISLEGHPVIAFGAGRGQVTFEFEWFHPTGADWRISGQRLDGLMQRLSGALGPRPMPVRVRRRSRRPTGLKALLPEVFGAAASAA